MKILMIGAHQDDNEFRAGGIAKKYVEAGHEVRFLSLSNGSGGHHIMSPQETVKRRAEESAAVAEFLGVTTPDTGNKTFPDIENHWAKDYIAEAKEKNIITGDDKGNFNPENSVTRAELVTMLMRAVEGNDTPYDGTFSDVDSNDWFAPTIAKALSLGIISEDTKFRPNARITREEMCKMIVNVYAILGGEIETEDELSFTDGESISPWAEEFVVKAVSAGLMNGIDENTFSPKSGATRAQAATVICRMLKTQ